MAIGSAPLDSTEIEGFQKKRAQDRLKHLYGCVWPDGRVTEHIVLPPKKGDVGPRRGDVPLGWFNGEVQVRKKYRRMGVRRFDDVCITDLGEIEGAKKYKQWREAIGLRGRVEIKNPLELYPPSVLKMRREHASGVSEDMVFVPGQGLVPATEERKAERVRDLLGSAELPEPTAEDRAAAKKAKP